ncbi:MAG TPA: peptide ABC transporter substrate-binding protein [Clostridiales bacterium]|nr:peptide ABC transporter substrate-binding protein [Clostridiales bacterium]
MKKRIFTTLIILALIMTMITGCSDVAEDDKVLVVRTFGDPMSFNPSILPDDSSYSIVQNIFNRLVKLDISKQIIPDLAEEWKIEEEGTRITFNLREDAKWHDGEPLTSKDVKYTFDTIKANENYFFYDSMTQVESIHCPDDYTVIFNLNEPDVSFVASLGLYATFIVPEHIFNTDVSWEDNPASMNPVGSGPFKFDSYTQGQSIVLKSNELYHEGAPKLDRLIFSIIPDDATAVQALISGQIDVLEAIPPANVEELIANSDIRMMLNEYPSPTRIVFNLNHELVQDVNVRRAIATAVDKEEISLKVYNGVRKPEYAMYPEMIEWVSNTEETSPSYSIEKAVEILESAGYTKDADGYYVRGITLDVYDDFGYSDVAKLMEATLRQAGIEIIVQVNEFNVWFEKVVIDRDFILELQGGFMGPDPSQLGLRYGSGSYGNFAAYSNPDFDELMREGIKTDNQEERAAIYREAQALLARDLPFFPIVGDAFYDANSVRFTNLPIDGEGKWGWQEYTYTDMN